MSSFRLGTLGHYFHPTDPSNKLAPGGAPYELQVGCSAILPYLTTLGSAGLSESGAKALGDRKLVARAYLRIGTYEEKLSEVLLSWLTGEEGKAKGVKVVGPETKEGRSPTISFVVVEEVGKGRYRKRMKSADIVKVFDDEKKVSLVSDRTGTICTDIRRPPLHPDRDQVRSFLRSSHLALPPARARIYGP
jgi:selenocysteine lyase/cysteine desulfurase